MKHVLFVGNRINVFKVLIEYSDIFSLAAVYVLKDSPLHKFLKENKESNYEVFTDDMSGKTFITTAIKKIKFDIFISNGCPFVLRISELRLHSPEAIFINIHPTYLPHLKGKRPLNGVFMLGYDFLGATVHFMDDGVDSGHIIYQEKVPIGSDIDQGLIYYISFDLEGIVFRKALDILVSNNFNISGEVQTSNGSFYSRHKGDKRIDFLGDNSSLICKKINSVGLVTQGIEVRLNDGSCYKVHAALVISNEYLLKKFSLSRPGDFLHNYSDKILVKTIDGIVKLSYV